MGGKRGRARQYLYCCAAGLLIALTTAGCAPVKEILKEREGQRHLQQGELLARQGDYQGALKENEEALKSSPKTGEAALFDMALIAADPANPGKNYEDSLLLLRRVQKDFPQGSYARQSAIWSLLVEQEVSDAHKRQLHLLRMERLTRQAAFADAVKENEKLLQAPSNPIADAALFSMGLIYVDPANPGKDYQKALTYFSRLTGDFPSSRYAEQANAWCGILKEQFTPQREASAFLERVRLLIRQEKFDLASAEAERLKAANPKAPLGDSALFAVALISAAPNNPKSDYRRALTHLLRLEKDFPQSPLVADAESWLPLLREELSPEREGRLHLQRMQSLTRKGDFEEALREDRDVLSGSDRNGKTDAALFSMGLIYAEQSYPKKDYKKAQGYFARLRREYPGSQFAEEARTWLGVLETMDKVLRIDLDIEQKKKELTR